MKLAIAPLFVLLAAAATSVLGQAASTDFDEMFAREDLESTPVAARSEADNIHALREIEEVHARHAHEVFYIKRDVERLERRGRMACYAACNVFTGANKVACWRRCDKIWGNTP